MNNKNNNLDYQILFNLCLQHCDNLLIVLSKDLIIKAINPVAEEILGWEQQDVCNKKINQLFTEKAIQPFFDLNAPLTKTKNISFIQKQDKNLKIIWHIIPNFNSDNACELIFIIGKNRTELTNKQLESLQFENIVKYAPGLFYWKDKNSVYQGCNNEFARLAGLESSDQVKGTTDFDLAWKDRADLYVKVDERVLKTGEAQLNHEEEITVSDDKTITAITNKVPLLDDNNQVIGILGITTDITHQKIVEHNLSVAKKQAEAASHAKSDFISNMEHDLRTPFSGIGGIANILYASEIDPSKKALLELMVNSCKQWENVHHRILDSLVAERPQDLHFETFSIRQELTELHEMLSATLHLKKIDFILDVQDEIDLFTTDKLKFRLLMSNLISNAVNFTEQGTIKVTAVAENNHCLISVSDTGIGIPADKFDYIFEKFTKLSRSNKYGGDFQGVGSGLYISRQYANQLGATIHIESELGKGSIFTVNFPVKPQIDLPQ